MALACGSARLGAAGAAGHRRRRGGRVRLGHGRRQRRAVLRRGGPQHVGKLARLHLRGVRSSRDRHRRQAARRAVGAGPVAADLRLSHLGPGPAASGRGRAHRPGALPGGPPAGRACGRPDRRGRARRHAHHRAAEPWQRVGLAADPAAGARRRRHLRRAAHRVAAAAAAGRRLGRPGVPGEDDSGLAGLARAGRRLPARRARGETAYPVRARRAGRAGHRRGVPVLDDRRLTRPVSGPALRGRQSERLGVHAGLRLQRPGPAHRELGYHRRAAFTAHSPGRGKRTAADRRDFRHQGELAPAAGRPVRGRQRLAAAGGRRRRAGRAHLPAPPGQARPAARRRRAVGRLVAGPRRLLQRRHLPELVLRRGARPRGGGAVRHRHRRVRTSPLAGQGAADRRRDGARLRRLRRLPDVRDGIRPGRAHRGGAGRGGGRRRSAAAARVGHVRAPDRGRVRRCRRAPAARGGVRELRHPRARAV